MTFNKAKQDYRDGSTQITEREYLEFSQFLQQACGITLGEKKQYLVSTRVRRLLVDNSLPDLSALLDKLKSGSASELRQEVIDVMTTNETFWFRDTYPFEYLSKTLLPQLSAATAHSKVKIWCAACSTGQEPYSISMLFDEAIKTHAAGKVRDVDILATDVSSAVLEQAKKGEYDQISLMRGLSAQRSQAYFKQLSGGLWGVAPQIKNRVRFRPFNLQDSYFSLGKFDIIFCRNVLIYFSQELKVEILKKMHSVLMPGGILFLGSSESISGLNSHFEMVHCNPGVAYRAKVL